MTDKKKKVPVDTQETLDDSAQAIQVETANQDVIARLQDDLEGVQQDLVAARSKADEYLDGWQRSRAEFTNYKKRIERDASQTYQQAAGSVLLQFLGIADDLERALKNRPREGEGAVWSNGIELVYRKLQNMLENEGVIPIQAEGAIFDPNFHEAIVSEQSDMHESGQVIEVVQQGYMLGEKVLRPAMVRVAR